MQTHSRPSFSPSHLAAGFITVLVGFSSSVVIIIQAAQSAGADQAVVSSWIWALSLGMGVTSIGLSLYYREPVLTAWSTPGAALLATSLAGHSMGEATGAFLFSAVLMILAGWTGWFDRLLRYIPRAQASAMLGGVLLAFGLHAFLALQDRLALVALMILTYLLGRRYWPRYAIILVLLAGTAYAGWSGSLHWQALHLALAKPVFTAPVFSLSTLISVGLPLFIVTMTSQNLPGLATLRANGYTTPPSPLLTTTGIATLVLAPFGGFALNLAAITAAICMGEEAGSDRHSRYLAAVVAGAFYILIGLFGATVVSVFAAFPQALVVTVAGLALLGTIGGSLHTAMADADEREPALIVFLVTASGVTILGIGSAFWGLALGLAARYLLTSSRCATSTDSKNAEQLED